MGIGWNYIILEGYCGKDWEFSSKHGKHCYVFDADKDIEDWEKVPNTNYDPDVKKPEWPEYCKKHVCYTCYEKDCPYFATAKGGKKQFKKLLKKKGKK